jgi:DNA-binding response OmpR family regulator
VRVLVVEDDPDTLAAVATALRDVDEFAVWVAREGQQALAVADELRFNADVLVLDLDLGPGMRGDQFAAEYRRRAPRPTPIIVVSGVPRGYELARSIRAAAVLAKPFDAEELVRTVRLFGGRSREDRAREEADKT